MDQDQFKSFIGAFLLCMAIMFGYQYFVGKKQAPQTQPQETVNQSQAPMTVAPPAPAENTMSVEPPQPQFSAKWSVLPVYPKPDAEPVVLGQLDPESGYKARIVIDPVSTGLKEVLLSEYKYKVNDDHTGYPLISQAKDEQMVVYSSLMLGMIHFSDQASPCSLSFNVWEPSEVEVDDAGRESVRFTATVVNAEQQPVLKIHKIYRYEANNYELSMDLEMENLSEQAVGIRSIDLYGPIGLVREDPRNDRRILTAAYHPEGNGGYEVSRTAITKIYDSKNPLKVITTETDNKPVEWFGVSNKFFGAVVRPVYDADGGVNFFQDNRVRSRILNHSDTLTPDNTILTQTNISDQRVIQPKGSSSYRLALYLGAVDTDIFDAKDSIYAQLGYDALMYRPSCAICTFNWLNLAVLQILKWIYAVVHNYGIAIIFLVLLVRFLLHPITKKSQVNMQKMSKLGPKMEEVKKKYANNPQELQRQTMALYKEQGWTPILGCLPMFLQMPIWIALYTAVDSNIAMRHKGLFPAGFFWLNDLSAPDRLIPFSLFGLNQPFDLFIIKGIDAFNILPILLCIAMFLQSKYSMQTQSKAMASTNPQMEQQQKMMLYMMPAMMLIFFYTAPSGLNLYIMASTFGGLIEQHYIRKHLKELEAAENEGKVTATAKLSSRLAPKQKKPKPPIKFT